MLHWYRLALLCTHTHTDNTSRLRLICVLLCFILFWPRSTFSKLNMPPIVIWQRNFLLITPLYLTSPSHRPPVVFCFFFAFFVQLRYRKRAHKLISPYFPPFARFAHLRNFVRIIIIIIIHVIISFLSFSSTFSTTPVFRSFGSCFLVHTVSRALVPRNLVSPLFWLLYYLIPCVLYVCLCVFTTSNVVIWQMIVSRWPSNIWQANNNKKRKCNLQS